MSKSASVHSRLGDPAGPAAGAAVDAPETPPGGMPRSGPGPGCRSEKGAAGGPVPGPGPAGGLIMGADAAGLALMPPGPLGVMGRSPFCGAALSLVVATPPLLVWFARGTRSEARRDAAPGAAPKKLVGIGTLEGGGAAGRGPAPLGMGWSMFSCS